MYNWTVLNFKFFFQIGFNFLINFFKYLRNLIDRGSYLHGAFLSTLFFINKLDESNNKLCTIDIINEKEHGFVIYPTRNPTVIIEDFTSTITLLQVEIFLILLVLGYIFFGWLNERVYSKTIVNFKSTIDYFIYIYLYLWVVLVISRFGFLYNISYCWSNKFLGFNLMSLSIPKILIITPATKTYALFNNLLAVNMYTFYIKLLVFMLIILVLWLSADFLSRSNFYSFEYPILLSLSILSIFLLISSTDLFLMWLSLELLSFNLYLLASINKKSTYSTEAGIKYLILGAVASGFLLFGISLVYGVTVETTYWYIINWINMSPSNINYTLLCGFLFITMGFFFKLSVAPFHVWSPDVYEGVPLPIMFFFAVPVKFTIFAFFVNFIFTLMTNYLSFWVPIFYFASLLSLIVGCLGGLRQIKLKRLFAYSAINNFGFILMALAGGQPYHKFLHSTGKELVVARTCYTEVLTPMYIYVLLYIIALLGVFSFLLMCRDSVTGRYLTYITDLTLLGKNYPLLCILFSLCLFSLAGIPPLGGFGGKFAILRTLLMDAPPYLVFLAIVSVITSVISAFYYVRLIKIMFFEEKGYSVNLEPINFRPFIVLFFSSGFLLFFFVFFWRIFTFNCTFIAENSEQYVSGIALDTYIQLADNDERFNSKVFYQLFRWDILQKYGFNWPEYPTGFELMNLITNFYYTQFSNILGGMSLLNTANLSEWFNKDSVDPRFYADAWAIAQQIDVAYTFPGPRFKSFADNLIEFGNKRIGVYKPTSCFPCSLCSDEVIGKYPIK